MILQTGTMISFLANIVLKSNLVSKKIFKNIKLFGILKYYIITIMLFILLSVILIPVESYFLSISNSFVMTILKLGLIFIATVIVTSVILYVISIDARNLFKRAFNLVKSKLKQTLNN